MNPIIIGGTTTNDLVEVLNLWIDSQPNSEDYLHWCADTTGFNHGLPIFADYDLTSIEEQCENVNAIAYPNPGNNILNIRTSLPNAHIEIYDLTGKLIHNTEISHNVISINAESWPSGTYIWKVISNGKLAESGKWIKK